MPTTPLEKLHSWLNTKTPRELIILSAATLMAVYFIWYQLLMAPLWQKQEVLQTNIITAQTVVAKLKTQVHLLGSADNKATELKLQQEHIQLLQQLAALNQELGQYKQFFVPPDQVVTALKSLLSASQKLSLVKLENLPAKAINADPNKTGTVLYEHGFLIELRGNYFATLQFLQKLENLPWDIYWDNLNYQVIAYPQADITIQLHILSNQEKLINV